MSGVSGVLVETRVIRSISRSFEVELSLRFMRITRCRSGRSTISLSCPERQISLFLVGLLEECQRNSDDDHDNEAKTRVAECGDSAKKYFLTVGDLFHQWCHQRGVSCAKNGNLWTWKDKTPRDRQNARRNVARREARSCCSWDQRILRS